jgi:thiol:disulfide interchange protein DsbC
MKPLFATLAAAAAALLLSVAAHASETDIRLAFAKRFPNYPKLDEVRKTPVPGIFELRFGSEIIYSDKNGDYMFHGSLIDTRTRVDLTQERIDKLLVVDFGSLPLKDAMVIRQGNGSRRFVVFADPNCGYCKRMEADLLNLKDVSIYTFLLPVLGPDSLVKSKDIWCSKDPAKAWRAWMVEGHAPATAAANCDTTALDRNLELGRKNKVQGTPALVFEDGSRAPGAIPAQQIEARLVASAKKP